MGKWLPAVWYPEKIDSPGSYTLGRLNYSLGVIPQGYFEKFELLGEILTKKKKIQYLNPLVTGGCSGTGGFHWWKKLGSKILLDCSFKKNSNFRENKAFQIDVIMDLCPWKNSLAGSLIFNAAELILRKSSAWIVWCKNNFCLPIF